MNCPRCQKPMEKVVFDSIEVDRCTGCKGIWFDELELGDLMKLAGSEKLDIGDHKEGRQLNAKARVDCPVCATQMIRMVALDQHHIWYECCKVCGGVFIDAGEFKDFKEKTVLDSFKDLFTEARK